MKIPATSTFLQSDWLFLPHTHTGVHGHDIQAATMSLQYFGGVTRAALLQDNTCLRLLQQLVRPLESSSPMLPPESTPHAFLPNTSLLCQTQIAQLRQTRITRLPPSPNSPRQALYNQPAGEGRNSSVQGLHLWEVQHGSTPFVPCPSVSESSILALGPCKLPTR